MNSTQSDLGRVKNEVLVRSYPNGRSACANRRRTFSACDRSAFLSIATYRHQSKRVGLIDAGVASLPNPQAAQAVDGRGDFQHARAGQVAGVLSGAGGEQVEAALVEVGLQ